MKHINFESGRSMVEMLGVLAIIGVLSVGAIAGYSYGMAKYRANETINDIMLRRTDLIRQQATVSVPTLDEWTDTATIYPMELVKMEETVNGQQNTVYGIGVSGVHSKTCQIIAEELSSQAQIIINGYQYNGTFNKSFCDISDQNDMDFYFIPTAECKTDLDCDAYGCSLSNNGVCESVPDGEYCLHSGICQSGECFYAECLWTGWLDRGKPNYTPNGGDRETLENICKDGWVNDIAGRAAGFPNTPFSALGQVITVDTTNGLICHNKDQRLGGVSHIPIPSCINYEINVYCCFNAEKMQDTPMGTECTGHSECCVHGMIQTGSSCITDDGKKGECSSGGCQALAEGKCVSFEDCETGEFCYFYDRNCRPLTGMTSHTIAGKTYYVSDTIEDVYYFSATGYCNAFGRQQGKKMIPVTIADFRRNDNELLLGLVRAEDTNVWAQEGCIWYSENGAIGYSETDGKGTCGNTGITVCHNPDE